MKKCNVLMRSDGDGGVGECPILNNIPINHCRYFRQNIYCPYYKVIRKRKNIPVIKKHFNISSIFNSIVINPINFIIERPLLSVFIIGFIFYIIINLMLAILPHFMR